MKTILFVTGTVSLFAASADAGNKKIQPAKPATLIASKTEAAKPEAGKTEAAKPEAAKPDAASPVGPAVSLVAAAPLGTGSALASDALDIPALAPDTSSALSPFPELERRPIIVAKPMMKASAKAAVLNTGKDYMLGGRRSAKPEREVEQIIPKSLSQAQVATVVQSHMSDIQNCWDLVPKSHRADACTAMLRLSISDAGAVTDIELGGDVPAGAHKCITSAVAKWTFPVAETKSDVEYGISLRSL